VANFPTFTGGVRTQLPASYLSRFLVDRNDQATGKRYAYYRKSTSLLGWELSFPVITDSELATLEAFFVARKGRLETFTLTDPYDETVYTDCRFGMDALQVEHLGPNHHKVKVVIVQHG
jgi:hypothetical protein